MDETIFNVFSTNKFINLIHALRINVANRPYLMPLYQS